MSRCPNLDNLSPLLQEGEWCSPNPGASKKTPGPGRPGWDRPRAGWFNHFTHARDPRQRTHMNLHALTLAILAALIALGCSFQTEALDDQLGTSCGHYALSHTTTLQTRDCWREDPNHVGSCFMSSQGACGPRATHWGPGVELTQWCPIGNPGTEVNDVVRCE